MSKNKRTWSSRGFGSGLRKAAVSFSSAEGVAWSEVSSAKYFSIYHRFPGTPRDAWFSVPWGGALGGQSDAKIIENPMKNQRISLIASYMAKASILAYVSWFLLVF